MKRGDGEEIKVRGAGSYKLRILIDGDRPRWAFKKEIDGFERKYSKISTFQ